MTIKRTRLEIQFEIRRTLMSDNEKLITLARVCPQKGKIAVYTDRAPEFFALNRLQGKSAESYLAETPEKQVFASVSFSEHVEYFGDRELSVLDICDLRVDPKFRRTKIVEKLIRMYTDKLRSGKYDRGRSEVIDGNHATFNIHKLAGEDILTINDGQVNCYQLLPVRNYRFSRTWSYRQATQEDLPAIADLLRRSYDGALGAPKFTAEWLNEQLTRHSSFTISDIWLAIDKNGQICASTGLWDQSSFRRIVVTNFSPNAKKLIHTLTAIKLLWKLPPIPVQGEPLRGIYLRWPAAIGNDVAPLAGLFRFLMTSIRKNGEHQFVSVGFYENDPLQNALNGIWKVQEKILLFSHWLKTSELRKQMMNNPNQRRFVEYPLF